MVKHRVVLDKYSTLEINIPLELTAMEFKALTMKASKLFNISSVSIEPETGKRKYTITPGTHKGRLYHDKRIYTKEMEKDMRTMVKQKLSSKQILIALNEKHKTNFTPTQIQAKLYKVRRDLK